MTAYLVQQCLLLFLTSSVCIAQSPTSITGSSIDSSSVDVSVTDSVLSTTSQDSTIEAVDVSLVEQAGVNSNSTTSSISTTTKSTATTKTPVTTKTTTPDSGPPGVIPPLQNLDIQEACSTLEDCYGYNVRIWGCEDGKCLYMKSTYTMCESDSHCGAINYTTCSNQFCQCVTGYGIAYYRLDTCTELTLSERWKSESLRDLARIQAVTPWGDDKEYSKLKKYQAILVFGAVATVIGLLLAVLMESLKARSVSRNMHPRTILQRILTAPVDTETPPTQQTQPSQGVSETPNNTTTKQDSPAKNVTTKAALPSTEDQSASKQTSPVTRQPSPVTRQPSPVQDITPASKQAPPTQDVTPIPQQDTPAEQTAPTPSIAPTQETECNQVEPVQGIVEANSSTEQSTPNHGTDIQQHQAIDEHIQEKTIPQETTFSGPNSADSVDNASPQMIPPNGNVQEIGEEFSTPAASLCLETKRP